MRIIIESDAAAVALRAATRVADLIQVVCENIEVLHRRLDAVAAATGPFQRSSVAFDDSASRADLLALVEATPAMLELLQLSLVYTGRGEN